MKRVFSLIIALLFTVNISAKWGEVTVHLVDGISLETALANYDRISVLTITGMLKDNDYSYLRSKEFKNKCNRDEIELNLKDVCNDSIPAKALYASAVCIFNLTLPKSIEYIGDLAFQDLGFITITGKLPALGTNLLRLDNSLSPRGESFYVSEDNEYCTSIDGGIYSWDQEIFFTPEEPIEIDLEIKDGTRTIGGYAFAGCEIYELVIPESVDSIGDGALAIKPPRQVISWDEAPYRFSYITCKSTTPPALGNSPFFLSYNYEDIEFDCILFVPDESVELYKNADGWKDAPFMIYPISEKDSHLNSYDMNIKVHLGEGASLGSQLARYPGMSIRSVVITGTPTLDDYAYMRTRDFFSKSKPDSLILDMKSAAVDTIPAKAFYALYVHHYGNLHIVFPESLAFIGDSAFADSKEFGLNLLFEVTGPFPKTGKEPCSHEEGEYYYNYDWFWTLSENNEYCVVENLGIYSADKKEFHTILSDMSCEFEVLPGTEIISDNAFSYRELSDEVVIPESVEYIGNYAFESIRPFISSNGDVYKLGIICMRKEPPLLGKEVFANNDYYKDDTFIFVPDESVELYRNAEGWKDAPFKIYPLSEKEYYTGIESIEVSLDKDSGDSAKATYDLQGRQLKGAPQKGLFIRDGKKYLME